LRRESLVEAGINRGGLRPFFYTGIGLIVEEILGVLSQLLYWCPFNCGAEDIGRRDFPKALKRVVFELKGYWPGIYWG